MRNRKSREGKREVVRNVSRLGYGHRDLPGAEEAGSVTRILIGSVPTASIVTFEQQPGHEPVAYLQDTAYREDYLRYNRPDLGIRPTGDAHRLSLEAAKVLVEVAYTGRQLPGGHMALDFARSY